MDKIILQVLEALFSNQGTLPVIHLDSLFNFDTIIRVRGMERLGFVRISGGERLNETTQTVKYCTLTDEGERYFNASPLERAVIDARGEKT